MNTELIDRMYKEFNISDLGFGAIHDKLGDAYEKFLTIILSSEENIKNFNNNYNDLSTEYSLFKDIMNKNDISNTNKIKKIETTTNVPHRGTGGMPKTDVIANVTFCDESQKIIRISSKQSTVSKVAMAEFDVNTICKEMEINNQRIKDLMLKHQKDGSAKNFTLLEKNELKELLNPISRDFVRWVITGCRYENPTNVSFPTTMVKFELKKPKDRNDIHIEKGDFKFIKYYVYTIEEYINTIMLNKNGSKKSGGFGTGLSWTYATGSKNKKIQFKG